MLIRPKNHWLQLFMAVLYLYMGIHSFFFKPLHSFEPFYFGSSVVFVFLWLGTFTTLENGHLCKQVFFIPIANIPVSEFTRVEPHKKNGKLGYGTCFIVYSALAETLSLLPRKTDSYVTLQPNRPAPFLTLLREQAPQAEFLL